MAPIQISKQQMALFHRRRARKIQADIDAAVRYPDLDLLQFLSEKDVAAFGFTDFDREGLTKGKKRRGRGRTLPNPENVEEEVKAAIEAAGLSPVETGGPLVWGTQNCENLDASKARFFGGSWASIFALGHLWMLSEVSPEGVEALARITGKVGLCADPNTRGQASGILYDPERLEAIGKPVQIDITNVLGVKDLRKALLVHLRDKVTGETFWACSVHLKSMLGGEKVTMAIRQAQADILVEHLKGAGTVSGDFNCKFPDAFSLDLEALKNADFRLVDEGNKTWTQAMGSWLDAFIVLGMDRPAGRMKIVKWWQILSSGRALTDHAMVLAS